MTNASRKWSAASLAPDRIKLAEIDDTALVALLLTKNEAAWRELVRRYEPVLRGQVGRTLARAMRQVLDSDAVDDVIGDLYLHVLENDMMKLRVWARGQRAGTLAAWLGLLANGIAIDHVRAAFLRRAVSLDGEDASEEHEERKQRQGRDADPNRGGAWLGAERAAHIGLESDEPAKRRRKRKSRDDE
jgi:hypothetical protein